MISRTYGTTLVQLLWTPTRWLGNCSKSEIQPLAGVDWNEVKLSTKQAKFNERQLSGAEIALATVAKWPIAALRKRFPIANIVVTDHSSRRGKQRDRESFL
jgi:hypothetical protein